MNDSTPLVCIDGNLAWSASKDFGLSSGATTELYDFEICHSSI
jgi:hypothetical protein